MADSGVKQPKQEQPTLIEVSYDDEEVALVAAATEPALDDDPAEEVDLELAADAEEKSEAQTNGIMVLSLLDKIIGVVDQIQQTQQGLETRQEAMEKSVSAIQGDLAKLSKTHTGTTNTVNKMLDKVRKVSVNVKTVRSSLEQQAGQIKKLESNERELLKRRDFKVLISQEEPPKESKAQTEEPVAEGEAVEGLQQIPEEGGEGAMNSDDEVEIEEIIEESRAQRIKRSSKERVEKVKKAFSKEKMEKNRLKTREKYEKTKQKTRDNMEKTRQRTREKMEKTKQSLEVQMGKLSTRMTPNLERKEKIKTSTENIKKSLTPDHTPHTRSKTPRTAVYRVPPFTFHVKKIRDGEEEEVNTVETVEVVKVVEGRPRAEEDGLGLHVEVAEGELVRVDSPEMEALLEVVEHSKLVLVETDHVK